MRPSSILLATLVAVGVAPSIADACSPPVCWPGYFTPANGATVPANVPALYWRPMATAASDPTRLTLALATDPTPLTFTASIQPDGDYLIVPTAPLVEGQQYTLSDHNLCDTQEAMGPTSTFTIAPAAALPTSLGTLAETDHAIWSFAVGTASGSCSTNVTGDRSTFTVDLSASALPWQDALHFETFVDGRRWNASASINDEAAPGSSWAGRGVDKIYDVCTAQDPSVLGTGLSPGTHAVTVEATLPGATLSLSAPALSVDLVVCPTGHVSGDEIDDGCSAGGSAVGPFAFVGVMFVLYGSRRRAVTRG